MSTQPTERYGELLTAAELSENERWKLLSEERRRIVCDVLADEGTPISFERLATATAAREGEKPGPDGSRDVEIALHHVHLPKLAEAGVIDYDAKTQQIEVEKGDMGRLTG